MAENCTRAFGRYLRTLRERRGLSLSDVCSLSQTFPDPINKGYLSRCENGHQKLAFAKMIPLSRIYEVPAEVLVERMELDLELDRVGGAETEGRSFDELTTAGRRNIENGFRWQAYGELRDAVPIAPTSPVRESYRDLPEQIACAQMNCATAARALGRMRFALHEFSYLAAHGDFGPKFSPLILERVAACHRELGSLEKAISFADKAIAGSLTGYGRAFLGSTLGCRAQIAYNQSDLKVAATYYHRAYRAYRNQEQAIECATTLNNLAQCHFDLGRFRAARRALLASQRISERLGSQRVQALSSILLGEIDLIEDRPTMAVTRWKSAVSAAKTLKDNTLRFKAEYLLFQQAASCGDHAVARAIRRRLTRLAPAIPSRLPELRAFKASSSSVSGSQR